MTAPAAAAPCPSCGKPVEGQPASCPECGLTFLSVCSCGATWHLLHPRCPSCGLKHHIRRKADRRFWKRRRFRFAVFGGALAVLLLVNLYFVVSQSPRRQKYHAYQDGLAAYGRGQFGDAAVLFRRYLEIEPESPEAQYMLGLALLRTGEEEEAERRLTEATRLVQGFQPAHIALSEYYRSRGDYRQALLRGRLATRNEPVQAAAWFALGEALMKIGERRGAIDAFKRGVEIDPGSAETLLELGDLYLLGRYLDGEDVSEKLAYDRYREVEAIARDRLRADATNTKARIWLAKARAGLGFLGDAIGELERVVEAEPAEPAHRLLLARFHGALGDFEGEDRVLAAALAATPTPELAIERARILAGDLRDPDEARAVLDAAIDRSPDHAGLAVALAQFHRNRNRFDDAERVLEAAVGRIGPDANLLEARGDLRLARGDPDGALAAWRETIDRAPERVSARKKILRELVPALVEALGRGVKEDERRTEAEAHLAYFLDPVSGLNPADPEARDWGARIAFAAGDFDRATDLLGGSGETDPRSYGGLRLLGASCLNRQTPDYARASQALFAALNHPDCPGAFEDFDLAWTAAFRVGHYSREAEIADRAVQKWPADAEWRLRYATSLLRDGRTAPAIQECGEARRLLVGTQDVRALLLASRIHQAAGDLPAAKKALEDAVAIRRDAETRGALFRFLAATGDLAGAEKGFAVLVAENPEDPDAFLRFGDFLLQAGRPDAALEQYEKARAIAPASRDAIYRIAELKMASASEDESRLSAAREAVARLRDQDPEDPYLDYFAGKIAILGRDWEEALAALGRYVRRNRNDSAGLYYLAIAYRRSGDLEKARAGFQAAIGLDPSLVEAKLELATLYFSQGLRARQAGDLAAARDAFGRVVGLDPDEPDTRRFLAETLASLGLMEEAGREAEAVLRLRPDDPGALFLSGVFAARRGEFEAAEGRLRKLVELSPDNYRSHLYLGMVLAERGRYDSARDVLRTAWSLEPEAVDVLHALVVNELAADRPVDALRLLEAERDRRPDHPVVRHLLGDVHQRLGRWPEAIAAWRGAFEVEPRDTAALTLAAAALADLGQAEQAIAILAEGEKRSERPAPILSLKGALLFDRGEAAAAETAFREAILADPGFVPALRGLGMQLARSGREAEGEKYLERAVAGGLDDAGVWFRLARVASARGEREKAVERYRAVLRLAPEEVPALNNLALLLSERGEEGLTEAKELATRARALAPGDPRTGDTLGWVLYRAGQFEAASDLLSKAAADLPDSAEAQLHAGMAAFRSYRWDVARPFLRRALELDGNVTGADEARAALDRMR